MINSTIKPEEQPQEKPFPKLMILTDEIGTTVILAISKGPYGENEEERYEGISVYTDVEESNKHHYSKRYSLAYKDFNGEITLSND